MDTVTELQNLLVRVSAEINNKKINDNRVQLLSLPRRLVNSLERSGYITKELLSGEQLLTYVGHIKADAYPQINHALVIVNPDDGFMAIKRYGNNFPEIIKIEYENEPGTND